MRSENEASSQGDDPHCAYTFPRRPLLTGSETGRASFYRKQDTMADTPVVSRPFQGDEVPPIVNSLNQAPLPTLNAAESAAVEEVNNEIISED